MALHRRKPAFGSDSVNCVAAPWDVLVAYYFRAVESAEAIPEHPGWHGWKEQTLQKEQYGCPLSGMAKQQLEWSSSRPWIAEAHTGTPQRGAMQATQDSRRASVSETSKESCHRANFNHQCRCHQANPN